MTYQRPAQPSSIARVLVDGFLLFGTSLKSLYMPALLLLIIAGAMNPLPTPPGGMETPPDFDGVFWFRLVAWYVTLTYVYAFIIAMVHYIASGTPRGVPSPLSIATRRFPVVLVVTILYGVACGIGTLLFIIPGVFLFIVLFASPILPITEGKGLLQSAKGSYALVKGHWWRAFAIVMVSTIAVVLMGLAAEVISVLPADWFSSEIAAKTVLTLTYAALLAIIQPLCFCIMYGLYVDLRLRHGDPGP